MVDVVTAGKISRFVFSYQKENSIKPKKEG